MGPHAEGPIERWTPKRRAALIMRVLKGETSVAEAARLPVLRVADVESWQEQYLWAAKNSFRRRLKDEEALKDEQIKKLQQKIAELVVENDVLQEASNSYSFASESHPHCSECIWNAKWQKLGTEESHRKIYGVVLQAV